MRILDVVNAGRLDAVRFKSPRLASYSVSRRAPAMHLTQGSRSRRTSSGTSPRVTTSDTARRRVRDERQRAAGFAHRRQATGQSWRVRVWEFPAANTGKRAKPVVKIRAAGKKPAIVRNTPGCCDKDHQTNVRRSWGEFGVGYSNCPRSGIRRRRLDCSGQRLPGSRP